MRKKFAKSIIGYMAVSMVVVILAIFLFQMVSQTNSNRQQAEEKLNLVKQKIESNEAQIIRLTEDVGENNLAKTRAFADMLEREPGILKKDGELDKICERLMVRELHVIDDKGIITHSTVPAYVGFDMGSGEQSAAFLVIIDDPGIEIVQEPQKNATEGIVVQYIGVARKDAKGLVQVGIEPAILEETLAGTAIDVVLADFDYGTDGYIFAIDKVTGAVLAHKNAACVGKTASEIGFQDLKPGTGKGKIDGQSGTYTIEEYGDYLIGTMMPDSEFYLNIISQTVTVSLALLIINAILIFVINRYVSRNIVKGIVSISESTKKIAKGDYNVLVQEEGNDEFKELSGSINTMVENIKSNLESNAALLQKQQQDVQDTMQMIEQIKKISTDIEAVSKETLSSSISIHEGSENQKLAIEALQRTMEGLSEELSNSAGSASGISQDTLDAVDELVGTRKLIDSLSDSMEEISTSSQQIEKIIDEISQIAQQTNMLSLNASIEAARAGELGKGFAVVASEVGALAERSSSAVKQTEALIQNALSAVAKGREITNEAVEGFGEAVARIEGTSRNVEQISHMMNGHVDMVLQAQQGLGTISEVVESNVAIAQNSEGMARAMAGEAEHLMELVIR